MSHWASRILDEMFAGVLAEERYRITEGNAIEFFHLDAEPAALGASATRAAQGSRAGGA